MRETKFKNTEIGKIPKGWEVNKIGEIANVTKLAGFEFTAYVKYQNNGNIIALRGLNVKNGKLVLNDVKYIDESDFSKLNRSKLFIDDMLFTYVGTVGEIALVNKNDKYYLAPNVALIRYKNINICPKFYIYYFASETFKKKQIEFSIATSSQPALSMANIRLFSVAIPPKKEQEKIATYLSDVDELIDKLTKLIEKKKLIKKGTMQELLTEKKRLKGYKTEWKKCKLGDIFDVLKGNGLSKDKIADNGINKCILYGELFTKYNSIIKYVYSRTNENVKIASKVGDILMPGSTTTEGGDLVVSSVILENGVLLGGDIIIWRKKVDVDTRFISYLIPYLKKEILVYTQGITIVHLKQNDMKELEIRYPSEIEEQEEICNIIINMDTEIEKLEKKLSKYKKIKLAMMDELLTGKTRLI